MSDETNARLGRYQPPSHDELKRDRKKIQVLTLPGKGTTSGTKEIAVSLPSILGTSFREENITALAHAAIRSAHPDHEPCGQCLICTNAVARARTYVGMTSGFVIGTGDLSEAFKGYCTFNGDHMSMYNVNCGAPKTMVNFLLEQVAADNLFGEEASAKIRAALALEISPELEDLKEDRIIQKTEEIIGPYILNDYIMVDMIRNCFPPKKIFWLAVTAFKGTFKPEFILLWLKDAYIKFFGSQFKRNSMPEGPKLGSVSFNPRDDYHMPGDLAVPSSILADLAELTELLKTLKYE